MSEATVSAGGHEYAIAFDRNVLRRSFVTGLIRDDADGAPAARGATIVIDEPLLAAYVSDDRYALVGDPEVVLTDQTIAHPIGFRLVRDGYHPANVSVTVPIAPSGPVLRDIALRHVPRDIKGQVLGLSAGPNPQFLPVSGAQIDVTGPAGPGGELPLLLRRPLRRDVGAGATVRGRVLAPLAAVNAAAPAVSGDDHIVLIDGSGVAAGQVLRVGPVDNAHWMEVATVAPDPDRAAPATLVWMTEPLAGSVVPAVPIARFTPGAFTGATANLVGDAFAGEGLLWVDVLPSGGDVLVLHEPGQPDRYHDRGARSGSAGDYTLRGFARMGSAVLAVSAAAFVTQTRTMPATLLSGAPIDWRLT